jgi:hypothetical protein
MTRGAGKGALFSAPFAGAMEFDTRKLNIREPDTRNSGMTIQADNNRWMNEK